MPIDRLYPPIEFPVSSRTPKISPLIAWNHEKDWPTSEYKTNDEKFQIQKTFVINLSDEEQEYIRGHVFNGEYQFNIDFFILK